MEVREMRKFVLMLAVMALGALVLAAPIMAARGPSAFSTTLTGGEGVPGPGDPDGSGLAEITLVPKEKQICYEITISGIEPATMAHIHEAPAGVAGPVVVSLDPPADGSSSGCADAKRSLINAISKNPSDYYVNVHNAEYMAGAVRGQL